MFPPTIQTCIVNTLAIISLSKQSDLQSSQSFKNFIASGYVVMAVTDRVTKLHLKMNINLDIKDQIV
jgi:hypothetical protein